MLKYVVEYVFFERARVWMYLLCDEVFFAWKFLLFFVGVFPVRISPFFLLFFSFPRNGFVYLYFKISKP